MAPIITMEGRLGKDPIEIANGKGLSISVACNVGKEKTDWYNVTVWDNVKLKDFMSTYLKKGSHVFVSGLITLAKPDSDMKGYFVNVNATSIQFINSGSKKTTDDNTASEKPQKKEEEDVPFDL